MKANKEIMEKLHVFKVISQESEYYVVTACERGEDILPLLASNRRYFGYKKDDDIEYTKKKIELDSLEVHFGEYFINKDSLCICTDEVFRFSLKEVS